MLVREGVAPGGYARAIAMLIRPDGTNVAVERCPVGAITRRSAGVSGARLADLLVLLERASG